MMLLAGLLLTLKIIPILWKSREVGSRKWEVRSGKSDARCQMSDTRGTVDYGLWTMDQEEEGKR